MAMEFFLPGTGVLEWVWPCGLGRTNILAKRGVFINLLHFTRSRGCCQNGAVEIEQLINSFY